jgi:hypothetical protein
MADRVARPLLFLDVDGTLLPYGGARLPTTLAGWEDWQDTSNPQLAKLVPEHEVRPFVWVDDEITDLDEAWVSAHHRGPALLHRVDSKLGLTDPDFALLVEWLRTAH